MRYDDTKSIHSHKFYDEETGTFIPPIYLAVVYEHPDKRTGKPRTVDRGTELKYGREENPTVRALERVLAALEAGDDALAFNSGMAALAAAILALTPPGAEIVVPMEAYGKTLALLREFSRRLRARLRLVWPSTDSIINAVSRRTSIVLVETMTNPTLKVIDVRRVAEYCRDNGAILVVDNTFATPVLYNPLKDSASLVVHSLTKYLAGHNDVLGGAVIGDRETVLGIWEWRTLLGGIMQAFEAYLALRGVKTLVLRVEKQSRTALEIAEFLQDHPRISEVYYPGLDTSPYKPVADKLFKKKLYGGVVSFKVKGGREEALRLMRRLNIIKPAPSLGGTESLITMPAATAASAIPPEDRKALGIDESLLRLSIGLEDPEDLIEDLSRALQ